MHEIKIDTSGVFSRVRIDGKIIPGVTGYTLHHEPGQIPKLSLQVVGNITIDYDAPLPPLPEPWASHYKLKDSTDADAVVKNPEVMLKGREYLLVPFEDYIEHIQKRDVQRPDDR